MAVFSLFTTDHRVWVDVVFTWRLALAEAIAMTPLSLSVRPSAALPLSVHTSLCLPLAPLADKQYRVYRCPNWAYDVIAVRHHGSSVGSIVIWLEKSIFLGSVCVCAGKNTAATGSGRATGSWQSLVQPTRHSPRLSYGACYLVYFVQVSCTECGEYPVRCRISHASRPQ